MSNDMVYIPDEVQAERVNLFELKAKQLENDIVAITKLMREIFDQENIGTLQFDIDVSGRVQGDLKIKYKLADNTYGGNNVEGAQLIPILKEFFRRRGWQERNNPKELPYA